MKYCPQCRYTGEELQCPQCGSTMVHPGDAYSLSPGTVLTGTLYSYRIEGVLGQGGFGITYAARNQEQNIKVALKEYFPTRCAARQSQQSVVPREGREQEFHRGLESFSGEARMLASLGSIPSVVRVLDHFQSGGTGYLVMEFLDGVPLHRRMKDMGGRIPPEELLPKLPPLLRDLEIIHQQGVLHRDITPDNIMWLPDNTLKLMDFGSARSIEGNRSLTVLLKQGFAPVEQYLTSGQGSYTDVYALCATIYYCLTGEMPPAATERLEEDTLQPPTALGVALTAEQEAAILAGMAVQPKQRTQSVRELAAALLPVKPPVPPVVPAGIPRKLLWAICGGAAILLLLLLILLEGL